MDKRVRWPERNPRGAWQIQYTAIGAFAPNEQLNLAEDVDRKRMNRLRSQCMIAMTSSHSEASQDALFLSAILLKLVQRGTLPRLPGALERALPDDFKPICISNDMQEIIASSLPNQTKPILVDPSFAIDPVLELPFWNDLNKSDPETCKWLTPQASLEALASKSTEQTRWVDFLYCSPFSDATNAVLEIDGSQHGHQVEVDKERDKLLKKSGMYPVRESSVQKLLSRVVNIPSKEARQSRKHDPSLESSMFLPSGLARFVTAVALLLKNGDIVANSTLKIDMQSDIEHLDSTGKFVFEFIRSIEQLWGLRALPNEVFVNGKSVFIRTGNSIEESPKNSYVRIKLEQHVPPHALLEESDLPTCVIRGAYLPVDLNFIPPVLPRPRFLSPKTPDLDLLLRDLLVDIFGHEDFRPNQLDAVKAGLFGRDSIVLLPTGSGKSLIYQMVGLLQPGITLVVDPIVSLIDDQVRSLKTIGIERTFGMHSGMSLSSSEMDEFQTSVANGQALFVFISPERLQTKRFRETLAALTKSTYVNSAVLDEAHCISEWGHDFRTAYLNVAKNLRTLCGTENFQPTLLALTGTASPAVLRDIQREIQSENSTLEIIRPETHDRPNLHYLVKVAEAGKEHLVLAETLTETLPDLIQLSTAELFETSGGDTNSGLIFTTNINGRYKDAVTVQKTVNGVMSESMTEPNEAGTVAIYSSTAPKGYESEWNKTKQENARKFIENEISVLVATKSFGMGIDKPNIRWTIHFGYPSSLEAFAQESGRSGRDNKDSYCVLLANPANSDDTRKILDLTVETEARRKDYDSPKFSNTDLAIHMYFHSNSFKGRYTEYARCIAVLKTLGVSDESGEKLPDLQSIGNSFIDVPDSLLHKMRPAGISSEDWNSSKESAESAIYRLNAIGIIEDYLVNFGSRSFTLKLGPCTNQSIDEALLSSMKRIAPGKSATVEFELASAPLDFNSRVEHHLKIFIETLYDTIEPARIRAITEMQQLASSKLSGEQVKARLNAYLSNGPLATAIEEVAESAQLDVSELTTLLDTVDTQDSDIWIGASARQLETYPDNPILLSARVVGEGWRAEPDMSIIESALVSAFSVLDQYQLNTDQASQLLNWISSKFEGQSTDDLSPKYNALAQAWESSGLPDGPILEWESEILDKALKNPSWMGQLTRIRERRIKRTSALLAKELERLSS
jgi:ATP-dependent DNA helicase RecQ